MSATDAIVYALLAFAVAVELIACLGVSVMRGTYDRIHYLAPTSLGAILIAAAIWVREGPSIIALKATLIAAFLLIASPALAHVVARAARVHELGDWRGRPDEATER
jgi:monovalent cation/proton antiporter MnhG/PhaG subunit